MADHRPAMSSASTHPYAPSILLALAVPASLVFALLAGSVPLSPSTAWQWIAGHTDPQTTAILTLRSTRAMAAFTVGGLLALSGALLQVLVRNPLADPYVLGLSGGAGVGALLAMLAGYAGAGLTGCAFAGAAGSTLLVFGLTRFGASPERLLLTGIVVATAWGAVISGLLAVAPQPSLPGMLFWLMGDLSYADRPAFGLIVLTGGLAAALALARTLDVLTHGETAAAAVGVNLRLVRSTIYFLASLLTATAVMLAGAIGFVGLIIPHLMRLAAGARHRPLLLNVVLAGGGFLVLADTLARTVLAPMQLPVGVITALIGVPLFLFLLARTRL
jgi:iron complex transport system permease protein